MSEMAYEYTYFVVSLCAFVWFVCLFFLKYKKVYFLFLFLSSFLCMKMLSSINRALMAREWRKFLTWLLSPSTRIQYLVSLRVELSITLFLVKGYSPRCEILSYFVCVAEVLFEYVIFLEKVIKVL